MASHTEEGTRKGSRNNQTKRRQRKKGGNRNLIYVVAPIQHMPMKKKRPRKKNRSRTNQGLVNLFKCHVNTGKNNNSEAVVSNEDSVIVCDSDSECEKDKEIIEIDDSICDSFALASVDESKEKGKEEIIVLDDSHSESVSSSNEMILSEKPLCVDNSHESSAQTPVPNSIVVVVSNTTCRNATANRINEIENSPVPNAIRNFSVTKNQAPNYGPKNSKQWENQRQASAATNNQIIMPKTLDFIPLELPVSKAETNSTLSRDSKYQMPKSIKVTFHRNDRLFANTTCSSDSSGCNSATPGITSNCLSQGIPGSIFGGNLYNAGKVRREGLRDIVIDGSNVAMGHSNGKFFSVKGLKICIDYFLQRGHKVRAFVPHFRIKYGQSSHPSLLNQLHGQGHVVLTPSREVNGKRLVCYDDRLLVQCAAELEAVVVSGDNYRDLLRENPSLKDTIEKRLLMPTWVDDIIIFPSDPLGRHGPSLDSFLRFP